MGKFEATMEVKKSYLDNSNINVIFRLKNVSNQDYYVLRFYTPFSSFGTSCFQIDHNNQRVLYRGPYITYRKPKNQNYLLVRAGESVEKEINLAQWYEFNQPGEYLLNMSHPFFYGDSPEQADQIEEICISTVSFTIPTISNIRQIKQVLNISEGAEEKTLQDGRITIKTYDGNQYGTYSEEEIKNRVCEVHEITTHLAELCEHKVNHSGTDADQFLLVFGKTIDENKTFIMKIMESITKITKTNTIIYHLNNDINYEEDMSETYAYTIPNELENDPVNIYLLDSFYKDELYSIPTSVQLKGMVGDVYHELSHNAWFDPQDNENVDHHPVKDFAYGRVDCEKLANQYPVLAATNADNYQYFISTIFSSWRQNPCTVKCDIPQADENPSLVADESRNRLIAFYEGKNSDRIHFIIYNGDTNTWILNKKIGSGPASTTTNNSPAAVIWDDQVYLFYNSSQQNRLKGMHCSLETIEENNWEDKTELSSGAYKIKMSKSPSAVIFQNSMYVAYTAQGEDSITVLRLNKSMRVIEQPYIYAGHNLASPFLFADDNSLYLIFKDSETNRILDITNAPSLKGIGQLQGDAKGQVECGVMQILDTVEDGADQVIYDVSNPKNPLFLARNMPVRNSDDITEFYVKGGVPIVALRNYNYMLFKKDDNGELQLEKQERF